MKITDDMLTEEFPSYIKPVYDGIYSVRSAFADHFWEAHWKNGRWEFEDGAPLYRQDRTWRGLKEPQRD
ncbi:hypothetical protein [Burkholderia sp. B21-007]|uniref:hypothetical protein n=1 Tax=Burkholderia sp. B21-007 TaxID=2890407 RepID=UPI001E513BE2|nr:hypothetical protein [Burkholderia sp. B21-007]UEP31571.1 hypothetical protein LMA01_20400 [Burkholderia sp. B21-007]